MQTTTEPIPIPIPRPRSSCPPISPRDSRSATHLLIPTLRTPTTRPNRRRATHRPSRSFPRRPRHSPCQPAHSTPTKFNIPKPTLMAIPTTPPHSVPTFGGPQMSESCRRRALTRAIYLLPTSWRAISFPRTRCNGLRNRQQALPPATRWPPFPSSFSIPTETSTPTKPAQSPWRFRAAAAPSAETPPSMPSMESRRSTAYPSTSPATTPSTPAVPTRAMSLAIAFRSPANISSLRPNRWVPRRTRRFPWSSRSMIQTTRSIQRPPEQSPCR